MGVNLVATSAKRAVISSGVIVDVVVVDGSRVVMWPEQASAILD